KSTQDDQRRLDYLAKVTGRANYLADMKIPGACHGKILRSPYPHARIVRIDASKALKISGVVATLTRDDILGHPGIDPYYGPVFKDQTIVAVEKARHVGDPVAAVAALDEDAAEAALAAIEVDYEELPAITDVHEALGKNAPLVQQSIRLPESGFADLAELKPVEGTNICTHFKLNKGDVEKGFAESDRIFEDTFTLPAAQHAFLEPHACIAAFEGRRLTVWSTTQNPFVVRTQLANIFRLPVARVRVVVPYLGGGYGGKVYPKVEPITVALAQKAGRPVRLVLAREEVFHTITKHAAVIRMKTGVKNDGTLVARECEVLLDTGAYAEIGPRVAKKSGYTAAGPYRIPHVKIDAMSIYTNKPPAGAFRGFGVSQSAWAHESQMDIIAAALKIDPLELRLKNGYDENDAFVTGERLADIGFKRCLTEVAQAIGWDEKSAAPADKNVRRGKGIACLIKATITPSISSAVVKLNEDGSASVYAGTVEMGQGSETTLATIAARELGVTLGDVQVLGVDTDVVPYDLTTSSSRSTFHMGKAVQLAAIDLKNQLKQIVEKDYGIPPERIEFAAGKIRLPESVLEYKDVMFKRFGMPGGTLVGQGQVKTKTIDERGEKSTSAFWFLGAGAAEVEVDVETGRLKLVRYVTAVDVGKAISVLGCRQQLAGAAITGMGQALFEELVYENGQLINPNFVDYVIPSLGDMPATIESILVEVPHKDGPFGAKGIGETALIPVAPAIANAVFAATGARIKDLPIKAEKIFLALEEMRETNR
ncbi:MAG TPA: xanthine dehydrogenase family protein molybdopterin-binding subunit, partial [Candidatus Binatia bacterium]